MLIQPDTNIRLIRNCPLDNSYDHTLYFNSREEQATYFKSLAGFPLSKQSYQRYDKGVLHVQLLADNIYDCNYLMFQNTSFGTKWFYAFITSVEYINNVSSKVYYEIDVMQTWLRDYEPGMCYIEREHSVSDVVGENTVPEGLDTGEYISETFDVPSVDNVPIMSGKVIVVASTFDKEYNDVGGTAYGGLYSGLAFNVFENTNDGMLECANFILNAGAKTEGIVSVFVMPKAFVTNGLESAKTYEFSYGKNMNPYNFDFKNKKLLTYPYNFLYISNLQGQSAVFPYEHFNSDGCDFIMGGDMSCNPSVVLAPKNYKGVVINYDEKMVLSGFPQCSYSTDSFKAWLAQNAGSLAVNAIGLAGNTALGVGQNAAQMQLANTTGSIYGHQMASLSGAGLGLSLATSIAGTMVNIAQHSFMPDQAHVGSGSVAMYSLGLLQFAFMQKHIKNEYAHIIDEYFNMFGYATHRVKKPNRNSRPHWNYVKTIGFVMTGAVPGDDSKKICNIYDRGITFWHNGDEVGHYELDNRPI